MLMSSYTRVEEMDVIHCPTIYVLFLLGLNISLCFSQHTPQLLRIELNCISPYIFP